MVKSPEILKIDVRYQQVALKAQPVPAELLQFFLHKPPQTFLRVLRRYCQDLHFLVGYGKNTVSLDQPLQLLKSGLYFFFQLSSL